MPTLCAAGGSPDEVHRARHPPPAAPPEGVLVLSERMKARFWARVDVKIGRKPCWEWKALINDSGYGLFPHERRSLRAHRVAWSLVNGPIPKGLQVCHHCDNRKCVNPDHLYVGTQKDNIADMMDRDRGSGQFTVERNPKPKTKLTRDQVLEVRRLGAQGALSQKEIGRRFGIRQTNVSKILRRESWRNL